MDIEVKAQPLTLMHIGFPFVGAWPAIAKPRAKVAFYPSVQSALVGPTFNADTITVIGSPSDGLTNAIVRHMDDAWFGDRRNFPLQYSGDARIERLTQAERDQLYERGHTLLDYRVGYGYLIYRQHRKIGGLDIGEAYGFLHGILYQWHLTWTANQCWYTVPTLERIQRAHHLLYEITRHVEQTLRNDVETLVERDDDRLLIGISMRPRLFGTGEWTTVWMPLNLGLHDLVLMNDRAREIATFMAPELVTMPRAQNEFCTTLWPDLMFRTDNEIGELFNGS